MNCRNRISKLYDALNKKLDAILIKNHTEPYIDNNFYYFTGLEDGIYEGCSSILYPDDKSDLIISDLEFESTRKSNDNINVFKNKKTYETILKKKLKSSNSIGLNFENLSYGDYLYLKRLFPKVEFINVSKEISKLRIIKDSYEIKCLIKSCEIVDKIITKIPTIIHKKITENELAAEIDYLMQKYGANKSAFTTISSFGKNTSKPHYTHGSNILEKGNFILCDFGANYRKYNSDITRTFIYGSANEKQKNMYNTVLNAQDIGINLIKEGISASKIHKEVFSYIENTEFKSFFNHSTGHSLGLNVHDVGGGIGFDSEIVLKENMIFTIEPGIYIPNYGGIRIEDDVLVTKNSYKLLTNSCRDLINIQY